MVFKWERLPSKDAAGKATADTTEVEIGNITVPPWAKSLIGYHVHLTYLRLTTDEPVSGYTRLDADSLKLKPLNLPLPCVQTLTGAIGTHHVLPISYPMMVPVEKNDILRAFAVLDAATTGVHTIQAYLCFSSKAAKIKMHADISSLVTLSTTANTESTKATITTIAQAKALIGAYNYTLPAGGITVDETLSGYTRIYSNADGWQMQRIPLNTVPSGLSTQITPITKPVMGIIEPYDRKMSGLTKIEWEEAFKLAGRQEFEVSLTPDGTNTAAPTGRAGIIYIE